jgi:hypothetical protein
MESAKFLAPADEEGILPAEIAGRALGAAGALDAFPEAFTKLGQALADLLALEGGGALRKPGADVGEVAVSDGGEPAGVLVLGAAGHLHEINRRDAVGAHELVDLPAEILIPFPAAIRAAEVIGREADKQNLRVPQRAEDAVLPVVHVADFGNIEEDAQRLGGEPAVVVEDVVAQCGDPALGVGREAGWKRVVPP